MTLAYAQVCKCFLLKCYDFLVIIRRWEPNLLVYLQINRSHCSLY